MSRPSDSAIQVTALRKKYTSHHGTFRRTRVQTIGLNGIDLAIHRGELYGWMS